MLTLQNVSVYFQNFGTVMCVFLVGSDKTAIEQRYFSFYNHKATNGDLEWWSGTCAMFWVHSAGNGARSAEDKLLWAMAQGALAESINRGDTKGNNPWPQACALAIERFESVEFVTWFPCRATLDMYDMGDSVSAEKGSGNFDDDILGSVVMRDGSATLDLVKLKQVKGTEEHVEHEAASVGQDV